MDQNMPDFMKKYFDACPWEGQEELKTLADRYERERQEFISTTFNHKASFLRDWNKLTGQRKELKLEVAMDPIDRKFEARTLAIARKYGLLQQDPKISQVSEKVSANPQDQKTERQKRREDFLDNLKTIRQRNTLRPKQ